MCVALRGGRNVLARRLTDQGGQLRARTDPELLKDLMELVGDGPGRRTSQRGDLLVAGASSREQRDRMLARREADPSDVVAKRLTMRKIRRAARPLLRQARVRSDRPGAAAAVRGPLSFSSATADENSGEARPDELRRGTEPSS